MVFTRIVGNLEHKIVISRISPAYILSRAERVSHPSETAFQLLVGEIPFYQAFKPDVQQVPKPIMPTPRYLVEPLVARLGALRVRIFPCDFWSL